MSASRNPNLLSLSTITSSVPCLSKVALTTCTNLLGLDEALEELKCHYVDFKL